MTWYIVHESGVTTYMHHDARLALLAGELPRRTFGLRAVILVRAVAAVALAVAAPRYVDAVRRTPALELVRRAGLEV